MSDNLFLGDTTYPHQSEIENLRGLLAAELDANSAAKFRIAQLESQLAEAKKDQARYQYLMRGLGAIHLIYEEPKWTFRNLPKCTKSVFKGSVSQHFSQAIDAAIASIQE